MSRDQDSIRLYLRAMSVLRSGGVQEFEALEREVDGFPNGADAYIGSRWIIHAIHAGCAESIRWMLSRSVELNFRDEAGSTPVLSALERRHDDRLEVLELLPRAGAPVHLKGINDWTPAHMAAARDDVDARRGFAGEEWWNAVIDPAEPHPLKETHVHHFEHALV